MSDGAPDKLRIDFPCDGDILRNTDGNQDATGLRIEVTGRCPAGATVRANGRPATVHDGRFSAALLITTPQTTVTACTGPSPTDLHDTVRVLWDRNCFKRYRYSTDDNIWFLQDLHDNEGTYRSLFDNPYLAMWKRLHEAYGTSVQHNLYWQTDGFNLPMLSDKYAAEWRDNAHWLKLAFHARANDPDLPYQDASYRRIAQDFEDIVEEILRFAGEEVLTGFTTIHWGRATREACQALRDRGIRGFACPYPDKWSIRPPIAYYLDDAMIAVAGRRDYWWDTREDLLFTTYDLCCNHHQAADFPGLLAARAADPAHSQLMEVMIHEQYFYPHYVSYLPDYEARVETCVRWLTENGYRSVQYDEGFLGA